jgi:hypothetical protein
MELSSAYRATLAIPVIAAAMLAALGASLGDRLESLGRLGALLGDASLAAVGASFWIGVPYVLYCLAAVAWSHGRNAAVLRRALNLAPILFAVWLFLFGGGVLIAIGGLSFEQFARSFARVAGPLLLYGYVCVAIAHAVIALLRSRGLIETAV